MSRIDYTTASGAVLGARYRLDRRLDAGGMAAVYAAEDLRLGSRVAVKLLHRHVAEDREHLERFRREALVTASLHHANIVQVLDFETGTDGPPFLVMELVEGEPLSHRVARAGPLSVRDATVVALQLLAALAVAHAAGVTHRDIKPGNVFLTTLSDGNLMVKLLDFGMASAKLGPGFERLTRTGIVLGTPATMAPEQARGEPTDARTDLYSVGAVLYFALTGHLPFESEVLTDLITRVILSPAPSVLALRPDAPAALAAIVARALAKPPADRFAGATEMATALGEVIAPAPRPSAGGSRSPGPPTHDATLSSPRVAAPLAPQRADRVPGAARPPTASSAPAETQAAHTRAGAPTALIALALLLAFVTAVIVGALIARLWL